MLIKVSGDLVRSKQVLRFIKEKGMISYVVALCGGGTAITQALDAEGIKFNFGPSGRITDFRGRQIARDILEKRQTEIQDIFVQEKINATVEIPVISIGGVLCHINGDDYLKNVGYNTFDELYCITTKERIKKKQEIFSKYSKIKIIGT